MSKILYQLSKLGKIQQWKIWVEENGKSGLPEVWVEHGLEDGKKQTTHDIIYEGVNKNKINETTPLQQAFLVMERKIIKQKEKGYSDNKNNLINKNSLIDFSKRFPKELCFYKPKNSLPENKIKSLKNPVYTVKRDGMMHIIRKSQSFGVEIYSRRMDLVTEKYPHIVKVLKDIPYEFILLGEIILDKDGKDDFNGVSQICRSDTDKAIEKQKELGWVKYYVFDIAFIGLDSKRLNLLTNNIYIDRLNVFEDNIGCYLKNDNFVLLCEILNYSNDITKGPIQKRCNNKTHEQALQEVKERGLEGIVVWDANGKMNNGECFTLNGKAYRPNVLWKSKPKYEDDFIVRFDPKNNIGEYGTGKNKGKVRSVHLYQLDDSGNEVFLAKCGGGLSDEQRDFYTTAEYPRVWRVEYDSIQPKTGSLRFPVFNVDRTLNNDKNIKECNMSETIRKARGEKNE